MLIYRWTLADVYNPPLVNLLVREMIHDPSTQLGMSNGWSSAKSLFLKEETDLLFKYIKSKLPDMVTAQGWGNILTRGQSIGDHNHDRGTPDESWVSGVYYLTPGILICGGAFHFQPGQMAIFGSNKVHSVPPADDLRVTIAFNARVYHPDTYLDTLRS